MLLDRIRRVYLMPVEMGAHLLGSNVERPVPLRPI
jgi:hypothetical protein